MLFIIKKYFIACAIILSLHIITSCQKEATSQVETLTIGLESGYPPFDFTDSKGEIIGFDIDVGHLIAQKLGKKLVIKDMEFEGEILSLKQGKIDLIISGMNITPSRLKEILMVPYHGEEASSLSLLFWKKIPAGITSLEDLLKLPNPTVSVQSGAVSEVFLSKHPDIQAKSFQGALAPLMDVKFGKSLANLVESDVAEYLKSQHPEVQILAVPLPEQEKIYGFGIGIKKENQHLFEEVSHIIQELKASGQLQLLEEKWFKGGGSV